MICLDDEDLGRARPGRAGVWPITVSGDGQRVAWRFSNGESNPAARKDWVIVDGREHPPVEIAGRPWMSRDGNVVAWWFIRGDASFIRIGDREEGPFDGITEPAVSPDGSTVAYAGKRDNSWFLKVNDKVTPLPGKPHLVFLSPNGREVGWVEMQLLPGGASKMRVVAFGKTGELFGLIGTPVFSPTEPLVAYGAEEDRQRYVIIGDRKFATPDRIADPVFSLDGRRVGYGALIGQDLWWKVLEVASYR